jgi:type II secretory pathway predicted ATPase ExeA
VVIGERGSGKTTLMNEFISTAGNNWQPCRIKLKSQERNFDHRWRNLNNRMVFRSRENSPPSIIIDDAHQLSPSELRKLIQSAYTKDGQQLRKLIQSAYTKDGQRKFQSIVLFAEPEMRARFAEMARWLPPKSVIDKIFMTPLTEKQTAEYLHHRLRAAGIIRKNPFTMDQVRKIHELSGGLPGWINGEAYMQLKKMKTNRKSFRGSILAKFIKWQLSVKRQCKCLVDYSVLSKRPGFHLK